MTLNTHKETLNFQTEVKQLLHLMIHSLYSNKEIFLRELISNSSDALDKLRFEALSNNALYENDSTLKIRVEFDKTARTISITDNGVGMTRQEVMDNLGTIAKSGTKEFLEKLTGEQAKDAKLIGQFGVGFYSSFIVADDVTVTTRRAGTPTTEGVRWESKGDGAYTVETIDLPKHGTTVTLHLKQDENEFLDEWRLRSIINKYSDHIAFPVEMKVEHPAEEKDEPTEPEFEAVNKATALWTRPRNEITEEEYKEFYKYITHSFADPLTWSHNRVEGKQEYISLLYIPAKAPFDLWNREQNYGLKLYVQRVFILDDVKQFLPFYLRFVRGVIDSNDLPLNVSRELLQNNRVIETIKGGLSKRVLSMLESLVNDSPEKYNEFWDEFGSVMKEGPAEDQVNKERIAKLLRFSTTYNDDPKQRISLEQYVSRMKESQDKIYYVTAESFNAAKSSPHLEIFRKKGIEVLLFSERVDEWLASNLMEFEGKTLHSVAKGQLDLGELDKQIDEKANEKATEELKNLLDEIKNALKDKVKDVRTTQRLTDSPACIVVDEQDLGIQMQRLLKEAGHEIPESKPILEVNSQHPLIKRLNEETDIDKVNLWAQVLLDQSILAEGGHLDAPAEFVQRLNTLMLEGV